MYAKILLMAGLFFLFILPPKIWSLQISEIMFNPSGSDTDHEWIEIYNNDTETYNMTGWKLQTAGVDHSLNQNGTNLILQSGAFAIIVQDTATFLNDYQNSSAAVIDSSWSDLSNSVNKSVLLKNSSVVFDNITYSIVPEGNSSCLIGNFTACIPTPGAPNLANASGTNSSSMSSADASFSFLIDSAVVNATYALFKLNLSGKDCAKLDNVTMIYNITPGFSMNLSVELACGASLANWTPAAAGNYTICGSLMNNSFSDTNLSNNAACKSVVTSDVQKFCNTSVSISSDSVANVGSALEYKIVLNDAACNESFVDVEYWIEDFFGNYVKAKLNTTQEFSCSKQIDRQWTPDAIVGTEAYKIKAALKTKCNDLNSSDNYAEKIIIVKGLAGNVSSAAISASATSVQSNSSAIQVKPKAALEIISYPPKVFVGEAFETLVNVSMNASFSIYSYVYSGNTPVSEWNGKGSWDANRQERNASGLIILANKIENGTPAGDYTMKVKIKADKDYDDARTLEVMDRPKLGVEKINSSFFISTGCWDCDIMVIGKDFEKTAKNFTLESPGTFHAFLLKDSKIFSRQIITIETAKQKTGEGLNKTLPSTGFTVKKNLPGKIDYIILAKILMKIKVF